MRYAYVFIAPIIAYSNFVLIAYNFTDLKEAIRFEIFTVFFTLGLIAVIAFAGMILRKNQMPTDFKLQYERNQEMMKTHLAILEGVLELSGNNSPNHEALKKIQTRINYLKKVLNQQNYQA